MTLDELEREYQEKRRQLLQEQAEVVANEFRELRSSGDFEFVSVPIKALTERQKELLMLAASGVLGNEFREKCSPGKDPDQLSTIDPEVEEILDLVQSDFMVDRIRLTRLGKAVLEQMVVCPNANSIQS